ncbi:PepSY domain-containing protein [Alteribacter natronophilus]|nr:PepSY domain-containing protein [Alteribacter natronophilus]
MYKRYLQYLPRQISAQQAMEIATSEVPGQVVDVDLDQENGMLVWEIEIITPQGIKYEVDIDANTGSILKIELD